MSQPPPPHLVPGPSRDAEEALTPDGVETILADFRTWLQQLPPPGPVAAPEAEPIDLHTLLGQFVALRHEVNLQTKATRAQQEQNAETLRQLGDALQALRQAEPAPPEDDRLRPLLKTLVDLSDVLGLARRETQRVQEAVLAGLDQLSRPAGAPTFWQRWLGRSPAPPDPSEAAGRVRQLLDSLLTGYTMSVQRVGRALEQHGLEPIPCEGERFDPEQMEVVEAVPDSGRPSGEVLGEVRRGYLWRGRVFRYAQVRVAR